MFATRRLLPARQAALRRLAPRAAPFHASTRRAVAVGDSVPNVELMENSPGNKVNIASELKKGKGLIIGKPRSKTKQRTSHD
jgi:2-Cys peroxiredoxin 5